MGRLLGGLALFCAAKPKRVVVALGFMTLLMGTGMTQLETDADLLKILPKDHPNTEAAYNASREFRGFYDFVEFFYIIDEDKCGRASQYQLPNRMSPADCANVTDETYIRGMEEIWQFIQHEIPQAEYAIDLAALVKVVNWTNSGIAQDDPQSGVLAPILDQRPDEAAQPRPEAYAMPGTDPIGELQFEGAWRGANAADDSINDVIAPTKKAGRTIIFFNTTDTDLSRVDLGKAVYDMVDKYQAAVLACDDHDDKTPCTLRWNVFSSEGLAVRGTAAIDAHASEVTQRDISKLAPIIIWAIILILYLAFRDVRVILVSAANLFVAFIWTAGLMGWLHIPFSALNMTIVPLILGVGIDYGIHMVSEFLEHKSDGLRNDEAFQIAGNRAGLAMAIATVTTMAGLLLMVLSPSVLMAQLGIVSSIALAVTFLFTMTLIPAVLSLTAKDAGGRQQHGSRLVLRAATAVGRNRGAVAMLVVVISIASLVSLRGLEPEPFGNPQLNYPEGDRVRDDAQVIIDQFFGGDARSQSNYLIVQGDLTTPESHAFLDALTANLQEHPDIQGFNTASLTRVVKGWLAIEQGTGTALLNQFVLDNVQSEDFQESRYPQTQEEIEATLDDIFASPMANFMTILLAPGAYDIGMVSYDTSQDLTFEEVQRIWVATEEVITQTQQETGYSGLDVRMFGNNAFSYLFITEEQPWVNTIGFVSYGLVVGMIAALTRNLRATACTAAVMGVTGLWWLGTLPLLGVGLSVGLMLPLVFIMAIGTDDAIHLIWNIEQTGNRAKVYRFVGKAVLLTSVTTFVAFAIFSRQTDLLVTRTLMATAVAVAVMWVATMLVVPLFYPPRPAADKSSERRPPRPSGLQQATTAKVIKVASPRMESEGVARPLPSPQRSEPHYNGYNGQVSNSPPGDRRAALSARRPFLHHHDSPAPAGDV